MTESLPTFNVDPARQSELDSLCRAYYVKRLAVFGSTLRGENTPMSDLDLLVEFDANHIPDLLMFVDLQRSLGSLFGKKVDLNTPKFLHPAFREEVVQDAFSIYAS